MNRTERLLDLIAFLLNAREPVSFAQIQEGFPKAYEGTSDAAIRKFERDKATLLELGIPLRWIDPVGDEVGGGYVIDRDKFYLPEIDLSPEEMAVVFLAGTAVMGNESFPYRRDLERALQKISLRTKVRESGASGAGVLMHQGALSAGRDVAESLQQLEEALTARKRVHMVYHTQYTGKRRERDVDPYALFCRQGLWSLVGYCHDREGVRVFNVHRMIELEVNTSKPRSPDFEIPDDFALEKFMNVPPWRYDRHEAVVVRFEVADEVAFMAGQYFGVEASGQTDGWQQFELEVTNADAVAEWVLGMGPNARITGPDEVRSSVKSALQQIVERYDDA